LKGEGENNDRLKEVMLMWKGFNKTNDNHRNQINLEEEINRNMKGKFKLLGHIGLMLFLVSALVLTLAPVAQAATAVTDVWVEFPAEDAGGSAATTYNLTGAETLYRIHFKATTALVRGVDKIIVQFPDGVDTTMGPSNQPFTFGNLCSTATYYDIDADGPGTTYGYYDGTSTVTAASQGGYRITLTIGVDIAAGSEVWLMIDDEDEMVTGGAESTTAYKVKVHTSKDTTPVLSKGFYLGSANQIATTASSISPTEAGATNVEYTFTFTLDNALEVADTITVTFPYGTTLPSSMSASSITVYDAGTAAWYTCGVSPTIDTDLRRVIVTTPHVIATTAGAKIKFATACGITNPTRAYASWGAVTTPARVGFIHTSDDMQDAPLTAYAVTHTAATNVDFDYTASPDLVTGLSDKYTMINMYSSPLYLQVEDQYGNVVDTGSYATAYITLESSSTSGNFYYDNSGTYTLISTTQLLAAGVKEVHYKDTTAGTYTLTASYSGLTSCTWTFQVAPAVSLYDQYDNLIDTFAPTSTSPVEEGSLDSAVDDYKGGYYVDNAIDAATAYDKVVLGDGSYEVDTSTNKVTVDKADITIKSVNGADYTTIDGSSGVTDILIVTAANVTIDGLTFKGLKTNGGSAPNAIDMRYGGFTIQNNKFVDNPFDNIWVHSSLGAITSGTITNNTLIGIGRNATTYRSGIGVESYGGYAISGINITNNTLSGFYGHESAAIQAAVGDGAVSSIKIQGNTVSGSYFGISLWSTVTGCTGTRAIASNTMSGNMAGFVIAGTDGCIFDLVKNTITDNKLYGIWMYGSTMSAAKTIKYNDISGNGIWGIYNTFSTVTNEPVAKYNWWGDATGPGAGTGTYASLTAHGSGDAISTGFSTSNYEPWLHKSLTDVVADNASYQAAEMKLVAGWNTLSTPVKLIAAADSIDELIPSGMTIGYYYDGGWQQITTGYTLSPCDAVYVKMSAATYVLLKFDAGAWTTPSKDLAVGWNLISLAYLSSSGMSDLATVASVAKTAAGLPGYSQLIAPSVIDAQTDLYGTARSSWAYAYGQAALDGGSCYPGLGYWVYMQNAATLAGFEITPIAPAFGLD
jgi:hypothetical protein